MQDFSSIPGQTQDFMEGRSEPVAVSRHDVVVVGGGYAGLSAALQLVRARRTVLVIDAGEPRNRSAEHSHGFLAADGVPPMEILRRARVDFLRYPGAAWRRDRVSAISGGPGRFVVETQESGPCLARRVLLATGVTDRLPDVPGLEPMWGHQVFHCAYCHALELPGGAPVGVLASSDQAFMPAVLMPDWAPTLLFLAERFEPDARQLAVLSARQVRVIRGPVERVQGPPLALVAGDGTVYPLAGLLVTTQTAPGPLVQALGCALVQGPTGLHLKTDDSKMTSVAGVYACGEVQRAQGTIALAVADGAHAGTTVHKSLLFADA